MSTGRSEREETTPVARFTWPLWLTGFAPLALLALLVAVFLAIGPMELFRQQLPPVEEVVIERITLRPDEILLDLVNDGPDPVTIAQVTVNEAFWHFEMSPGQTLPRLGRAQMKIRYPWDAGDAQIITLLSSNGVTFDAEIPVATNTPRVNVRSLARFAMLGVYVGVIPVFLGILWLPFIRRLRSSWYQFFLAVTIGLLVFLGVDALAESLEAIEQTPAIYQGIGVAVIGFLGTILLLALISQKAKAASSSERSEASRGLVLAYMIAFGIGVHNLGEGLAIGGAYAMGEVSLGAMLILGFMIHNVTEGLAIVSPVARHGARVRQLLVLGLLAGLPTIIGTWTGAFSLLAIWSVFFLAIGAGAVFQVVYEIAHQMGRSTGKPLVTGGNVAGFLCGLAVMYVTGFFATF